MEKSQYHECWIELKGYIKSKASHGKNELINKMDEIECEQAFLDREKIKLSLMREGGLMK